MTVLERRLRDLVADAVPTPDWVDAVAREARGDSAPVCRRARPRRRTLLGAGAIAIALAGAVLAVALRHPETAPRPAATAATTLTTPTEPQAASPLGAALRTVGAAAEAPTFTGFRAALADRVLPGTVRRIRAEPPVYAYELRNGAACLDAAGALDCAVPAAHRLLLDGALTHGDTAEVLVVVAPDVTSVAIERGGQTIPADAGRPSRAGDPRAGAPGQPTVRRHAAGRLHAPDRPPLADGAAAGAGAAAVGAGPPERPADPGAGGHADRARRRAVDATGSSISHRSRARCASSPATSGRRAPTSLDG